MTRKLTLKLDTLSVKSFETAEPAGPRGTVRAHEGEGQRRPCYTFLDPSCQPATYHTCASFDRTC